MWRIHSTPGHQFYELKNSSIYFLVYWLVALMAFGIKKKKYVTFLKCQLRVGCPYVKNMTSNFATQLTFEQILEIVIALDWYHNKILLINCITTIIFGVITNRVNKICSLYEIKSIVRCLCANNLQNKARAYVCNIAIDNRGYRYIHMHVTINKRNAGKASVNCSWSGSTFTLDNGAWKFFFWVPPAHTRAISFGYSCNIIVIVPTERTTSASVTNGQYFRTNQIPL